MSDKTRKVGCNQITKGPGCHGPICRREEDKVKRSAQI